MGRRALAAALACACTGANAGSDDAPAHVRFDATLLRGAREGAVDLSAFESGAGIAAGVHDLDVVRNGERLGRRRVRFAGGADATIACIDTNLADWLGIDAPRLTTRLQGELRSHACVPFPTLHPAARADYDPATLGLRVTLPQALLRTREDAPDPATFDAGIPALRLSWAATALRHRQRAQPRAPWQGSLRFNGGANAWGWQWRHRSAHPWHGATLLRHQVLASTVERDVLRFDARLTLGDFHATGPGLDAIALRGVRFASDDRMVPAARVRPAPVVRGVADTQARVQVRQAGLLLLDTTVPPGPFAFDDLQPLGRGGALEVRIVEADGRERAFDVPHATIPGLLRPGRARFGLAAGAWRGDAGDTPVMQGVFQRGVHDRLTLQTGAQLATGHALASAGVAFVTGIGAFSLDRMHARTTLPSQRVGGAGTRVAWSTHLSATGTHIDANAWRRDGAGFHSLAEAMRARANGPGAPGERERLSLALHQAIGTRRHALTLGTVHRRQSHDGRAGSVQLAYALPAGRGGAALQGSIERTRDRYRGDTHAALGLSLPLRIGALAAPMDSHAHARAGRGGGTLHAGLGGGFGAASRSAWRLGYARADPRGDAPAMITGALAHEGRAGRIDVGASASPERRQWALSGEGGMVLHAHGITFGPPLGDTIALVRATHGAGAEVIPSQARLDRQGRALVPSLAPYRRNRIGIDPRGASPDSTFEWTERDVVPRAGAVVDIALPGTRAAMQFARIVDGEGRPARLGARLVGVDGASHGVVGRDGLARVPLSQAIALGVEWSVEGQTWRCTLAREHAGLAGADRDALPTHACLDPTLLAPKDSAG